MITSLVGHLVWEIAQLPLYTIFRTATVGELTFAIVHCTAGDMLIAFAVLLWATILAGGKQPLTQHRFVRVSALATFFGVCYTIVSEWLNTTIRGSWSYTDSMPLLPVLGTGIAPFMQWLVVPPLALAIAWRCAGNTITDERT